MNAPHSLGSKAEQNAWIRVLWVKDVPGAEIHHRFSAQYNHDLASSGCLLFGPRSEAVRRRHFARDQNVKEAAHAWLVTRKKICIYTYISF
jgi:hypothetical protein